MSIRADDLSKLTELVDLLDDWKVAAATLGLNLMEVRVQPDGAYQAATLSYEDNQAEPAYWSVNG